MRALKVALWVLGTIVGIGLVAFGLIAMFYTYSGESQSDQQDSFAGGVVFLLAGVLVLAIVLVTWLVVRRRRRAPWASPQLPGVPIQDQGWSAVGPDIRYTAGAAVPWAMTPPARHNTRDLYKEWHSWAQRQFGQNDVVTHAAAMAAVQAVLAGGDTTAAVKAAQDAATGRR
jgi:hypothetical protein